MLFAQVSTGWDALERFLFAYAPVLFFVTLGGVANYVSLPKGRRTREKLGRTLGVIALAASPGLVIGAETSLPETVLFYIFAVGSFIGAGSLITRSNPVHAALFFALVLLSVCGMFLLNGAPFIMAATIIIYAGAIVVTFLFVIMLAQQAGMTTADHLSREPFLASLTSTVLLAALGIVLLKSYDSMALDSLLAKIERAARAATVEEVERILGNPEDFSRAFDDMLPEVNVLEPKDRGTGAYLAFSDAFAATRKQWARQDIDGLKAELRKMHEAGLEVRSMLGNLQAPEGLPVSKNAGTPAGQRPGGLPAANVAALGKVLFTDYLLAVEIAGMLLLVAAIGALAIATRRAEGTP